MNLDTIKQFCSPTVDIRSYLEHPFTIGHYTAASNGHALITIPSEKSHQAAPVDQSTSNRIPKIITRAEQATLRPITLKKLPDAIPCETCAATGKVNITTCTECDGDGEIEFQTANHKYCVECKKCAGEGEEITQGTTDACFQCGGNGHTYDDITVKILNLNLSPNLLKLIINLPDLHAGTNTAIAFADEFYFRSGPHLGIIMAMRT